jgi:phosphoribosylglycinamide formyltransferase-1
LKKIAIFTSGKARGSNFCAIWQYLNDNQKDISISYIIVTQRDAPIVRLAEDRGVSVVYTSPKQADNISIKFLDSLNKPVDLICLSGFMRKLPADFISDLQIPMINIHPSLLPKFGGQGMFGMNVHNTVHAAGERETGATVHYVTEDYDAGEIIDQLKCQIEAKDTPETIAEKVSKLEWELYPRVICKILDS